MGVTGGTGGPRQAWWGGRQAWGGYPGDDMGGPVLSSLL